MSDTIKKHISISQIGTVKRCPRQWVYRYIENKICPPGIALVVGSSFDEAYNLNYSQKIESKQDLPVEEVQQKFSDELDKRIEQVDNKEERDTKDEVKDKIVEGIKTFHTNVASKVQPVDVQTKMTLALDSEFDFLGVADVVTAESIIDNKTAGRKEEGKYHTQLMAYIYLWHQLTGETKTAELNYLIKTKKPDYMIEKVTCIDPTQFIREEQNLINYIKQLYKTPEIAFKNQEGWHCDPKWCGFYHICHGK